MKALSWTLYLAKILASDELRDLVKLWFARHRGDPVATREELSFMKDHWADAADDRRRIDAELAALKAQGK